MAESQIGSEQLLQTVRPATRGDLGEVVRIHSAAFPDFFMTQLGPRFLAEYYRVVVAYPQRIFLVSSSGSEIDGFVAGFVDASAFYSSLRRRAIKFGLAIVPALLQRPSRLRRVLFDLRKSAGSAEGHAPSDAAELASVAVAPSCTGRGVGARLVDSFITRASNQGARFVFLTTDAEDNDVVNRFYLRMGFALHRTFMTPPDRKMNEYRLTLTGEGSKCAGNS